MNKLSRRSFIFEILLFLIVVIIGVFDFFVDFNLGFETPIWVTFISYFLVTVGTWRVIQKIVRVKRYKVPGKTFEFLFFFFLFIATYSITFLASYYDKPEKIIDSIYMYLLFMPSLISAAYSGWLHYIEGITGKRYWKPKIKKKMKKNKKEERMKNNGKKNLTWILIICIGIIFIISSLLLFSGLNILVIYNIPIPSSVTFWFIFIGTISLWFFIGKNDWFFGDITKLKQETLRFYYSEMLSTLRMIFAGFTVALTILWGFFGQKETSFLQAQSLILILFLTYIGVCLLLTIIRDFKNKIE